MNHRIGKIGISFLLCVTFLFPALSFAHEGGAEHNEQHQIEALLAQIAELVALVTLLQEQLALIQGGGTVTYEEISQNLVMGDENEEVRELQVFLNSDQRTQIAQSGPGSPGNESNYFGNLTRDAVIKFQNLYKDEVLTPVGLSTGTGFVGPSTRTKMNQVIKQKNAQSNSVTTNESPVSADSEKETEPPSSAEITSQSSQEDASGGSSSVSGGGGSNGGGSSSANSNQSSAGGSTSSGGGGSSTENFSNGGGNTTSENDDVSNESDVEDEPVLGEFVCTGTLPENAAGHGWDEFVYLTADYEWHYSETDTENFCEYFCHSGHEYSGGSCVPVVENTVDPNNYTLTRISMSDPHPDPDNSHLLNLAFDDKDNLWVIGEFQKSFMKIDTKTNDVSHFRLPDDGKIFAWMPKGKTTVSILAEDITRDSSGNIWFTQGGGFLGYSSEVNHSRIVFVDTDTNEITTYKVPGNHNQVIGIMYDKVEDRIYFVESAMLSSVLNTPQPRLVSFTPGSIDTSIGYDDPEGLLDLRCDDDIHTDDCYLTKDVPFEVPAQLVKGQDGNIYFSGYFNNYLGRYNPITHEFVKFALPTPRSNYSPDQPTSFPWDIAVDPTTGDILMTETFDQQIVRFRTSEEAANSCQIEMTTAAGVIVNRGSSSDENCIVEYDTKPSSVTLENNTMTHSLDVDQHGNIWFTTLNYVGVIPVDGSATKYRQIVGGESVPEDKLDEDHMTGIKVNDDTGEVWANAFYGREVYRLTPDFSL